MHRGFQSYAYDAIQRLPKLTSFAGQFASDHNAKGSSSGYLVKHLPPPRILEAIREAHGGGAPMSMSSQVARLVVQSFQRMPAAGEAVRALTPRESEILDR